MPLSSLASTASAAERAADWEAVVPAYERLFEAAIEAREMEVAADALRGLSRACQQRHRLEEAAELAELSLEIAERTGCSRAAARALNTLAVIRFLEHHPTAAADLYAAARERATDCGDDALIGWSCQNLGVLANLAGDLREARALYLESVASSVRSGDDTTAATAYNSLGIIAAELEDWMDSMLYFDRGLEVADDLGDLRVQATMLANRAEPLIFMGEMERASATLDRAESLAARIGDQRTLCEVHRFRGLIARLLHQVVESESHLSRALAVARSADLPLEGAEATEELAHVRWREGRAGAARVLAREALRTYEQLGAGRNARRARDLLADWTDATGPLGRGPQNGARGLPEA